ncbi:TPA: hypothetical protein P6R03_005902 [Pseudomonas aeruginosa]|uniref:hypothetical protein n=1 Tax=Bacillus mobilis TaxID=2026190 RepID=UPI0022E77202|nr:hypothetical protein [Bacillus mobilis]HDP4772775.1 hypothetical protein [Pseudomonas aeruginosa]HDP4779091.1 hypothetical protein [Pseudomonas aeruginosa]HDP4811164.1 hypothetical protein [Pseudomonas aeruginosa]HDP4817517.1 hypothetical protein [Pseudomonas aeruginosa]HDP4823624.1 hypothetical protein [Pseudomonas aeruginosa]
MLYNLLSLKQEANGLIAGLNGRDISSMSVMEKARYSNSINKVKVSLEAYKNADQELAIYVKELDYLRGQLAGVGMQQQETLQQKNKRRAEILQNGLANTPYPDIFGNFR